MKGLDAIWFISDNFGFGSFEQHYFKRDHTNFDGYIKEHFEINGYFNSKNSLDINIFSRQRNLLVSALNENKYLPKLIVMVPDDDFISFLRKKEDIEYLSGRMTDWLMTQIDRAIESKKEFLQAKSKRNNFPHIIWIEAPNHIHFPNNELRDIFNNNLRLVGKTHPNVSVLQLKKIWETENTNLYLKEADRYTSKGLNKYWEAVDRLVKFADTTIIKRITKAEFKNGNDNGNNVTSGSRNAGFKKQKRNNDYYFDRFHWPPNRYRKNWNF